MEESAGERMSSGYKSSYRGAISSLTWQEPQLCSQGSLEEQNWGKETETNTYMEFIRVSNLQAVIQQWCLPVDSPRVQSLLSPWGWMPWLVGLQCMPQS